MSTTDNFDFFSNVFGFIVAVISLTAFLINIFLYHLPSNKIKKLESLIDETDKIFKEAMEEGWVTQPMLLLQAKYRLLVSDASELRCRVYNANTPLQKCFELLRGTSASIRDACQSVEELRAHLMTLRQEGRHRPTGEDAHEVSLAPPLPALLHNPSLEHHPCPFPSPPISRPSSFPIETQEQGLPSVQRARKGLVKTRFCRTLPRSVCTDSSCDCAKGGSDVREADTQLCISSFHTSVTVENGA